MTAGQKVGLTVVWIVAVFGLLLFWAAGGFVPANRRAVCTSPDGGYFAIEGHRVEQDFGNVVARDDNGRVTRRLITGVHDTCIFYRDRLDVAP